MPPAPPSEPPDTPPATDPSASTDADAANPTRRRAAPLLAAGTLVIAAVAVVALMSSDPGPTAAVLATGAQSAGAEVPPPTVGAPRESRTDGTAPSDAATSTVAPIAESEPGVSTTAPSTTLAGGVTVPSTIARGQPSTGPDAAGPDPVATTPTTSGRTTPTAPPPTATPTTPPPTAPPTTRYVPQFGEVEFDYAADGVSLFSRNPNPRIPVGGRAYWTNHTDLADLELIVNGASAGFLAQHRSARLTFDQPGTFTWSIAGYPGLTGTVTVG